MKASFNLARLMESLKEKDSWHKEKMDSLENNIKVLEEKLDEAYMAYERHRGARAVISDILDEMVEMVEFPSGNPMTDPMAHSDQ